MEEQENGQGRAGGDHSGIFHFAGEELGDAVLDLVLSHELGRAEVETLDLLCALRQVGPVEHGGLLGNTGAHLQSRHKLAQSSNYSYTPVCHLVLPAPQAQSPPNQGSDAPCQQLKSSKILAMPRTH